MPPTKDSAGSYGEDMAGEKDAGSANVLSKKNNKSSTCNKTPSPKTEKPRPHRCATCTRGFARLEHLKRHERSHTKEKPFECPECARRFARRDLLLRHQQKLHSSTAPSPRTRNRRDSGNNLTSIGQTRMRKNSLVNGRGTNAPVRPRANTVGHIGGGSHLQMMDTEFPQNATASATTSRPGASHIRHSSLIDLPVHNEYQSNFSMGMTSNFGQRVINHGLPRLDTSHFHDTDFESGMRTAPLLGAYYEEEYRLRLSAIVPSPTINPNALHFNDSSNTGFYDGLPAFRPGYGAEMNRQLGEENADWMNSFVHQMSFTDDSSPSAISTASPSGISDVMLDGSNNPATSSMWQPRATAPAMLTRNSFSTDLGNTSFHDMMSHGQPLTPLNTQFNESDSFFSTSPMVSGRRNSIQGNSEDSNQI